MSRLTTEELRQQALDAIVRANNGINMLLDAHKPNAQTVLASSAMHANQIAVAQVLATLYAAEVVQPYQVTDGSDKYGFGSEKISTI